MALFGEDIADPYPDCDSSVETCVSDVVASRVVDLIYDLLVKGVDRRTISISWNVPERDNRHGLRGRELERRVVFHELREVTGKTAILAYSGFDSRSSECPERHPRFQRAEAASELIAVIHVIDRAARRVELEILSRE